MQRQAYQLSAGKISNLKLVTEELADPGPEEVTVAVKAIGLNFADIFAVWGLYAATPKGVFVPGLEYAGEIVKVGSEVTSVKPGDRIMGITRFGAYASHLNIDHRYVIALPDEWTYEEGASYLVQVLTAYYGLKELGNLQQDYAVLIHSAAGGVGIWANRIVKAFNGFTIGTVGRPQKIDLCKQEGYDEVIVRSKNFAEDLKRAQEERELLIVMECIGGRILKESFEAMAPMGRMISYGSARYASKGNMPNYPALIWKFLTRPKIDPQTMTTSNKSVMAFNLIFLYERVHIMNRVLQEIQALDLGKPIVGHTFTFDKMKDALALFQSGATTGKVVITV